VKARTKITELNYLNNINNNMTNEETIYECSADNTKWYGSNQTPEVCPVCGAEGSISVPQDFDSSAEKETVIAEVEPVIESAPVADEVSADATNSATVEITPDLEAETQAEAEIAEPVVTDETPA
jgi:hypothetical protein